MKRRVACITAVILLFSLESIAASNFWSRIGPFGGSVTALEFEPGNPANAIAVSSSEVIVSNDGGSSWRSAYFEGRRIQADMVAASRGRYYALAYTATTQRILTSTDSGSTWTGPLFSHVVTRLRADPQNDRIVYAVIEQPGGPQVFDGYHVIARSTDAGATWTSLAPVATDTTVYDLVTDPQRANVLYAGAHGTLSPYPSTYYKSTDGGATWTPFNSGLPGGAFAALSADTSHPDTLYMTRLGADRMIIHLARSTDGGVSWQVAATSLQPDPNDSYVLVPDPLHYGTLYWGSRSGFFLYRSIDGGFTWARLSTPASPPLESGIVVPHPTQPGRLFAVTRGGLFRTDDGSSWQEITNGFSGRSIAALEIDPSRLIVRLDQRSPAFLATTNDTHWSAFDASTTPIGNTSGFTGTLGPLPWSGQRYALTSDFLVRVDGVVGRAHFFQSDDGGLTWTTATITGAEVPDFLFTVTNESPPQLFGYYYVWTCGARGCFPTGSRLTRSSDGGVSWHTVTNLPAGTVFAVASSSASPPTILIAQQNGISRSTDGGATLQAIPFTETIAGGFFADPHHPEVFYSVPQISSTLPPQLYRSSDSGATWERVMLTPPLSVATGRISDMHFSQANPNRVDLVTAAGYIARSEDAGVTWKALTAGPGEGSRGAAFGRGDPTTAYLVTSGHGIASYTIARDAPVEVVEFHNGLLDHYFITAAAEEADGIDHGAAGPGWSRTGYAFKAWIASVGAPADVRPVCRFYGTPGAGPNSHFYTIDPDECAAVQHDPGWTLEATDVFYLYAPSDGACVNGKLPVNRAYNDRFAQNDSNHRYATNAAAYSAVLARGWKPEGVVLCAEQ